jgi:hypothetical protein
MCKVSADMLPGVTMCSHNNSINLVKFMKAILYCMLFFGFCSAASADVQIKFKNAQGGTSTISSNGYEVRINSPQMPGYVLVDRAGAYFMVDPKRNEAIRATPIEIAGVEEDQRLSISLKPRGVGEKIAGYGTGRFDLISNGIQCGILNGSSELMQNQDLRRLFEAIQGMHKMMRSLSAGMAGLLTECQRATSRLADLVDTAGFILRVVDDKGNLRFEVLSVTTDANLADDYYTLPAGTKVVDMNEKVEQAMQKGQEIIQQVPSMEQMMQPNGGQGDAESQPQLKQMMDQMQELQTE